MYIKHIIKISIFATFQQLYMAIKNDTKLTCQFKIDTRNLKIFDPSTQKI